MSKCFLASLETLGLRGNRLSGQLTEQLGEFESIQTLDLGNNSFTGPIPVSLGRLSSLTILRLDNNKLTGTFPLSFGQLSNLDVLVMENNMLEGEIPDCWMNQPSLQVINLGNNNLSGTIPGSMGLWEVLSLNLYDNALSGMIPYSLQNCTRLIKLDLSGNNLSFLHILDLADNEFSGGIPTCIDNLTAMSSESKLTNFSGETYYSYFMGVFMESALLATKGSEFQYDTILSLFSSIDLSNNQLSGQVPEELTSLAGLRSLNLSGNHLTGVIPSSIGKMGLLESLDLSRNGLSGEIPLSITHLNFLNYLNLSFNNLSGRIPVSTQLQSFSSSSFVGNELCGLPLPKNCTADGGNPGPDSSEGEDGSGSGPEINWFYVSVALGFIVGFWGSCGTLIFKKSWRVAYFRFVAEMWRKVSGS
ncbi:hypothetical protein Sango_0324400 [Sesamum angolense]|uniref:Uncharacterized protein n=1 Tax=Sesamum angolense TaxID=2727404 RepID=A0AAE2C385_9LAMI|nr:hypothetical protein Sango_0324400 [Sesamum angolense]